MADTVGAVKYDASIDTSKLVTGAASVEKTVKGIADSSSRNFKNFASNASSAFSSVADNIAMVGRVAAGVFVTGALGAGTFVKSGSELQSLRASFESLTGSVEATNSVMSQLYSYGKETAFQNKQIQKSAKLFLANGVAVEDLSGWMKDLGDVAGATGADLEGLALPITQAIGAGKVMTQDWYQIINQGAGGLQKYVIAALGAGHSTKTFKDDLAAGAVTADVMREALRLASKEGGMAFRGAIKQSLTFNGRMSNLIESITNVGLGILGVDAITGEVDPSGVFAKLSDAVSEATKWLTDNKDTIKAVAKVMLDNAVPAIAAIAGAFVAAKVAAVGFSIAANANIFGVIVTAIAGVVAAIIFLETKFGVFSEAWGQLKEAMQPVIDAFNQYVLPVLKEVGNYIKDTMLTAFNDLKEAIAPFAPQLKELAPIIVVALLYPIIAVGAAITTLIVIIVTVIGWIAKLYKWLSGIQEEINKWVVSMRDSGAALIDGFIEGIKSRFGAAIKTVKDLMSAVSKYFPHSPAKEGPFSGKGYTSYSGKALMQDFAGGMASQESLLTSTANNALSPLSSLFNGGVNAPNVTSDYTGSSGATSGTSVIQNNNIYNQIDLDVASRQLAYQVARG